MPAVPPAPAFPAAASGPRRLGPAAAAAFRLAIVLALGSSACDRPSGDPSPANPARISANADQGPTNPEVDALFADFADDGPGAAVGVLLDGAVAHRAGYGLAHLDHGVPITPATVFDIASISKQFGAMTALLLEAEGELDLDAAVGAHVPGLPAFAAAVTPRHLIHHTSGIRDWPHVMALAGVEMTDVISFEKILRMLGRQRAGNFPPGSEYAYSNTGYNLLARTVEATSGATFREYAHERIFAPLGMTRTHFSDDYTEVVPGRAESYRPAGEDEGGGPFRRLPDQLTALASSSLHTTIDDFLLWMRNYETGQVGGDEIVRVMTRRGVLTGGDTIAYAYGLTVGEYRGLPVAGHGGSWAGYRTSFVRFPEQRLSVAVFCNRSDCDASGRARRVAEAYLGDVMEPAPSEPEEEPEAEPDGPSLSEAQLQEYAGEYRSPELDSSYEVVVESGRLVVRHWRNPPGTLSPVEEDLFSGDQWWFPEVRFARDRADRVDGFTVTGSRVRDLIFERVR